MLCANASRFPKFWSQWKRVLHHIFLKLYALMRHDELLPYRPSTIMRLWDLVIRSRKLTRPSTILPRTPRFSLDPASTIFLKYPTTSTPSWPWKWTINLSFKPWVDRVHSWLCETSKMQALLTETLGGLWRWSYWCFVFDQFAREETETW